MQLLIIGKNKSLNIKVAEALVDQGDFTIDKNTYQNENDFMLSYKNHDSLKNQILLNNHIVFELERLITDNNADSNYAEWRKIEEAYKNSLIAVYIKSTKRNETMTREQELIFEREALKIHNLYSMLNWIIFDEADDDSANFNRRIVELVKILKSNLTSRLNHLPK